MTEYDPTVIDIFSKYKHGELNKKEATEFLRPHFGAHEGPVISALLSAFTRQNIIDFKF